MRPGAPRGLDPDLVRFYYQLLGPVRLVLDLGCGPGDIGRYKPDSKIAVVGLDHNVRALLLSSRFEAVSRWDGEDGRLPFRSGQFDGVVAKDILEHLQRPWMVVEEIFRVLKPNGAAVVSVPMARADAVWADYTHVRGFTARALRSLFEDQGFVTANPLRMGGVPFAGRLSLVRYIPFLLRVPPLNYLFGSSYTMLARRPV